MRILKGIALVAVFSAPVVAFAHHNYGAAGCGLGSIVIGDKPGFIQLFAGTTNGVSGSQSLGITSGTSNCKDEVVGGKASLVQETFVSMNMENLSRDAAAGGGEYLSALSLLMGCETGSQASFFTITKTNHASIFTPSAEPTAVMSNLRDVLAKDETIAKQCKL